MIKFDKFSPRFHWISVILCPLCRPHDVNVIQIATFSVNIPCIHFNNSEKNKINSSIASATTIQTSHGASPECRQNMMNVRPSGKMAVLSLAFCKDQPGRTEHNRPTTFVTTAFRCTSARPDLFYNPRANTCQYIRLGVSDFIYWGQELLFSSNTRKMQKNHLTINHLKSY